MWFYGVVAAGFAAGVWWVIRWLTKWKDPSWDSREGQSRAKLWSKLNSGGGAPG